jgi:plasmid stabilization system protein ParE
MPRAEWTDKQERKYEHIKEGAKDRGASTRRAKEIAARTVQKERARKGQTKTSSKLSRTDISSSRRGGLRSHGGPRGRTRDQLYNEAKNLGIRGRSSMNKDQLRRAVDAKKR